MKQQPANTYSKEIEKKDKRYYVTIEVYDKPIFDGKADPMRTKIIITGDNKLKKELYLAEPMPPKNAVKMFSDIEKKLTKLLK